MPTERPLSVAEACELPAGDADNPAWVNAGVTGHVASVTERATQKGGKMWVCVLRDTTGSATIEFSMFTAPKFNPGDLIDVTGKGLRRTDYNGKAQLSLGKSCEVHRLGRVVEPEPAPGPGPQVVHRDGVVEPEDCDPNGPAPLHPVMGQTVGMAIKEAITLVDPNGFTGLINSPDYWRAVHAAASDIIRVSRLLERGQLAPSARLRAKASGRPPPEPLPPPPRAMTEPPPPARKAAVTTTQAPDEDVPF